MLQFKVQHHSDVVQDECCVSWTASPEMPSTSLLDAEAQNCCFQALELQSPWFIVPPLEAFKVTVFVPLLKWTAVQERWNANTSNGAVRVELTHKKIVSVFTQSVFGKKTNSFGFIILIAAVGKLLSSLECHK